MVSVQDRDYRLLRYNRQFKESFHPKPGSYCYQAYRGRDKKCDNCPLEKTFIDGKSHYGEKSGIGSDKTENYWIFITSPIKNEKGEVVSAIEMSLNISERKQLEKSLMHLKESTNQQLTIFPIQSLSWMKKPLS